MRMKTILGLMAIISFIFFVMGSSLAQKDDNKKAETIICPVSGEEVLKSEAAGPYKYKGTEYYFCCNGCLEKFKKDPESYLNKAKDLVCGMDVDKRTAIKVSYEGKEFYFCSAGCKAAFEKDPKTYAAKAMKAGHNHGEGDCQGCEGHSKDKADKAGAAKKCCEDQKTEKKL
ncbi:MAG: YHS domain-containing protein [candidate division KSB1 bacterium]|nr:YHS domain-containing protein [candidate division KSB1 bacterium]